MPVLVDRRRHGDRRRTCARDGVQGRGVGGRVGAGWRSTPQHLEQHDGDDRGQRDCQDVTGGEVVACEQGDEPDADCAELRRAGPPCGVCRLRDEHGEDGSDDTEDEDEAQSDTQGVDECIEQRADDRRGTLPTSSTNAFLVTLTAIAATTTPTARPTPRRMTARPRRGATSTEAAAARSVSAASAQTRSWSRPISSRASSIALTDAPSASHDLAVDPAEVDLAGDREPVVH